ncbi:MAG: beta-ketoacyl-ACP synthase 3 [Ktedonobacterales bacterium]|nr:beta-ketoacyl-ACP synthase 3 [Ktedonobacterales bacterium]
MVLPIKIAGVGAYLPERRVTNAELGERLGIPPEWIERASGVRERRYVTAETSAGMGAAAARMALADAGLELDAVDVIIGASTGMQQAIPCTAALVQRELGAPEGRSACFDVNATCLSFLFALHNAAHLIAGGAYTTALIYSSEINSPSLNPNERESAVLFGDAVAAAVITRAAPGEASGIWQTAFATYSSGAEATEIRGGGTRHHPNDPTTTPDMHLFHMDGRAIFRQATVLVDGFLERFFAQIGWERDTLAAVVPHQASRHAIEQLTKRYGFREDQVVWDLAERGNCVAASIPLTLAEAVNGGRIQRGDRVLLVGTGAGLTLGALALTY